MTMTLDHGRAKKKIKVEPRWRPDSFENRVVLWRERCRVFQFLHHGYEVQYWGIVILRMQAV